MGNYSNISAVNLVLEKSPFKSNILSSVYSSKKSVITSFIYSLIVLSDTKKDSLALNRVKLNLNSVNLVKVIDLNS